MTILKKLKGMPRWVGETVRPYLKGLIIIFILNIIASLSGVGMVLISKRLIDAAEKSLWEEAVSAVLFFTVIILIQVILKAIISSLTVRISESMSNHIREKLFLQLTQADWSGYTKYHSGDILTRMTNDTKAIVEGLVKGLPEVIALGTSMAAAFIILFIYDSFIAVTTLVLIPFAALLGKYIGRRFMNINLKTKEAESRCRSYIQECIERMLVLKVFGYEKYSREKLKKLQEERLQLEIKSNRMNISAASFFTGGYWLSYLIVFGRGALRLAKKSITFGTFTAFIQLVVQIQNPFMELAQIMPGLISSAASIKRVMELENMEKERSGLLDPGFLIQKISLYNVRFSYTEDKPVIINASTDIYAGDIIGLIGTSGEGKTTLLQLLVSLFRPSDGYIYVSDHYNKRYMVNKSIRSIVSYVPQGNTLFSGTISDNLCIGCPNASLKEQINALKDADAWEFVENLPNGINTVIGENGHGLSEGQSQRIAIARALLRGAQILILDEATSALDQETERRVLQSIKSLNPRRTCIIVSHRPSLLNYCNRIFNLSKGILLDEKGPANEAAAN